MRKAISSEIAFSVFRDGPFAGDAKLERSFRVVWRGEVCSPDFDNSSSRPRLGFHRIFAFLSLGLGVGNWCRRRLFGPNSVDAPPISRDSAVVAKENAAHFKWFVGPGVVA